MESHRPDMIPHIVGGRGGVVVGGGVSSPTTPPPHPERHNKDTLGTVIPHHYLLRSPAGTH